LETLAWLTPYVPNHPTVPPITSDQTECRTVGSGSALKVKGGNTDGKKKQVKTS